MFKHSIRTGSVLTAFILSGCVISMPFNGPGYESGAGMTLTDGDEVHVAVTYARLKQDQDLRSLFWSYVEKVEGSLEQQKGFIGYSLRKRLFGDEAWTMTVWANEDSLNDFVYGTEHREAMRNAIVSLDTVRTGRFVVNKDQIPLSWDKALALLDEQHSQPY